MRTLILTLVLCLPVLAHAEDARTLKQLSLEALGNVEVVTASKIPETLWRTPAALFVITQDDIRRSGATTIPDALRLAPGVIVEQMDGDHWIVSVRGMGDQFSKSLNVLIDGRSIYTPLLGGVNWPSHDVMISDIERIEVIRGPGGVVWGPNAMNGVVNIISKRTADTLGTQIEAGTGNVDHGIGTVRVGWGNPEGTSYRVYGKARTHGPLAHDDGVNYDNGDFTQVGFRLDRGRGFTLQGDLYQGRAGQSLNLATFNPPMQYREVDPLHVDGGNLMVRYTSRSVRFQAYYDRTELLGPQVGELRHTFDVDFTHRVPTHARNGLTWGLNARVSPSHVQQTIPTLSIDPHDRVQHTYSAFVQDQIDLVDNQLALTLGSKFIETDYVGFDAQPSARLLWTPRPTQTVWASLTRAIRTPSRLERDFDLSGYAGTTTALGFPLPLFIRIAGSDTFESERLLGEEAGYRTVLFGQVFLDVSAFHNNYTDLQALGPAEVSLIQNVTPRLRFMFPYANGVQATSNGVELAPEWSPATWWRLRGSYSYLQIAASNQPGNVDFDAPRNYEGSSPRHQVRLSSFVTAGPVDLDATVRTASALPALLVPGYTTIDAHGELRLRPGLRLTVAAQNLLGEYVQVAHDPPPNVAVRRRVFVGLVLGR